MNEGFRFVEGVAAVDWVISRSSRVVSEAVVDEDAVAFVVADLRWAPVWVFELIEVECLALIP